MATADSWINQGGYFTNPSLASDIRRVSQPLMALRPYVRKMKAMDKGARETVNFDKLSNMTQEYATAPLSERQRIPEDTLTITQGSITVDEWGRAFPYTHKLEALSLYSPDNIFQQALRDHMAKTYNFRIAQAYKATYVKYCTTSATVTTKGTFDTDGTISLTALRNLNALDLRTVKDWLVDVAHCPPFTGALENASYQFVFVASATTIHQLLVDADIKQDLQYAYMGQGANSPGVSGKLPVWQNILFVSDNQAFSRFMGTTAFNGEAIMFGADAVVEMTAEAPGIRAKIPEDFGRSKGFAWYAIDGYATVWGNNSTDVPAMDSAGTPTGSNTSVQVRIVHFTSL